ncbi:ribonuclease E inhibitor RraB [Vibrio vulnificus]|nr:ribonuclease E inhibitor RraB [Vibrio vulnificus]
MSRVVDALLDNAYQDLKLLQGNDQKGDVFSIPRNVDFLLFAKDASRAELVASFINDNSYGEASYTEVAGEHRIQVVINMPITQNVLNSVSGLMTCLSVIYDLEYDGWGCELQKNT